MKPAKVLYYKFLRRFALSKTIRNKAKQVLSNKIFDSGSNNKIIIVQDGRELDARDFVFDKFFKNAVIKITGSNNVVKIHLPITINSALISIDSDNVNMEIGKNSILNDIQIICWGGG